MSAISTGPPPWPIPPSWAPSTPSPAVPPAVPPVTPPPVAAPSPPPAERAEPVASEGADSDGAVVVFCSDGPAADSGVTVRTRPLPGSADGLGFVRELARAAEHAAGEGARGIVVAAGVAAPQDVVWALDLLYAGEAPLALVPDPNRPEDLADAVTVAAAGPRGLGCVLVTRGEFHASRHVAGTGAASFGSPSAGPLGHVAGGSTRLLWPPPRRVTVTGTPGHRSPLVGVHVTGFADDGRALRALAEHCDGLIVTGPVPDRLTTTLTELAARVPVVLSGPCDGPLPTTALDAPKARILMHLLLEAGRDHDAVLAAFTAADHPDGARL